MPARPYDPSKPAIYLDQSTLSDALKALVFPSPVHPAYSALPAWIERVAREANLCLSTTHIAEISRWGDHGAADGLVAWIDSLPTVWMRSMLDLQNDEDDFWTKVAAGITPKTPVKPFTGSIITAFSAMSPRAAAAALTEPGSARPFLEAGREYGFEKQREEMRKILQAFVANEAWVREQGWDEDRKRLDLALNRRADLRETARDAATRMNARGDADLAGAALKGDVQDKLVELVERDPSCLPSWRVVNAFCAEFARVARRLTNGSGKQEDLVSSFWDYQHLAVAAAYCDVFTCDGLVARAVHPVRDSLGRGVTLTAWGQSPERFVEALMATWPIAHPAVAAGEAR